MVEVGLWPVFRRGPAGGSPCPVVLDADGLAPAQMQALAAHYGQETAFVTGTGPSGLSLRYFVPRHEMRMCVHATVAAVTALAAAGRLAHPPAVARTASGEHEVSWDAGDPPAVTVGQHRPSFSPPVPVRPDVAAALRLPATSLLTEAPIRVVSVSRAKLIVPVRDADAVHQARPDLPALWALCRRLGCTGAYVFAPHPDGAADHVVARQFPVDAGFTEDPATGVAAAALAACLAGGPRPGGPAWLGVTIDQGDAMGQPSTLRAAALAGPDGVSRTSVTGQAVRTGRDRIDLAALTGGRDLPEPELR